MYLYREAIEDLKKWKAKSDRKPLVVDGARQTGKTSLIKEFGRTEYKNIAYLNLEGNAQAQAIFDGDFDIPNIVRQIEVQTHAPIAPSETLIFIDEVQENPRALTALKYFQENASDYHVIVAGSLLGVAIHEGISFPVGKVNHLMIHPLTFNEFLLAIGEKDLAKELLAKNFKLLEPFHEKLKELLRTYWIVGGMPEVVAKFAETKSLLGVREVQEEILGDYSRDFSKHAKNRNVTRIQEIFDIIPAVLAKENKKFMFGMIRPSARAREYETALLWLTRSGVATKVERISKVAEPLSVHLDHNTFKLFTVDVGLLSAQAKVRIDAVYDETALKEFKGALAEQFVFQELNAYNKNPRYFSADQSDREIDFVVEGEKEIIPIEVKSGKNLYSVSLNELLKKNPKMKAYKFSMRPYHENEQIINAPLYSVECIG